jgi:endonuclease/exonuclease/phosphatase family metal-dependent hydrolase
VGAARLAAPTFPARLPVLAIDHVFVRGLSVAGVATPTTAAARLASDHLPLVVDLSPAP